MAPRACYNCLAKAANAETLAARPVFATPLTSTRLFSAASLLQYPLPSKAKGAAVAPKRGEGTAFSRAKKKKKIPVSRDRPPAPGERKSFRKRVVLSNSNAFNGADVRVLGEGEEELSAADAGKILGLDGPLVDQMRAAEAFKPRQNWNMLKRPAVLVRADTLELAKWVEAASSGGSKAGTVRKMLVGPKGSGKSVLLSQAMALAFLKKWVVIHIPETRELTMGQTDYAPQPGTTPQKYFQKEYTASLLQRIAKSNPVLKSLTVTQQHSSPIAVQKRMTLDQLCNLGLNEDVAHAVLEALMKELSAPSRPPILLSADGLSRLMANTSYKSADFEPIHAHDFVLVDWFLQFFSGKKDLPNGGIVMAALSISDTPTNATLQLFADRIEAQQPGAPPAREAGADSLAAPFYKTTGQKMPMIPQLDPFFAHDQRVVELFNSVPAPGKSENTLSVKRVQGLNKEEARAIMEYWARSGILMKRVDEQLVDQSWTLSGGGIIGELERSCFRLRS